AVEDLADDAATGVRGLPQRLGVVASTALSTVALGAAVALFLSLPDRATVLPICLTSSAGALSLAALVRAMTGRMRGLCALSVLAVLPLVVAVAVTGGVRR